MYRRKLLDSIYAFECLVCGVCTLFLSLHIGRGAVEHQRGAGAAGVTDMSPGGLRGAGARVRGAARDVETVRAVRGGGIHWAWGHGADRPAGVVKRGKRLKK